VHYNGLSRSLTAKRWWYR